mmetsp:Transcript_51235/g.120241  ORF Transcript_51235/g.120241 Transcript_51235/m.120241 type:complete len:282 (-) Transcript_51235:928-1773(-)
MLFRTSAGRLGCLLQLCFLVIEAVVDIGPCTNNAPVPASINESLPIVDRLRGVTLRVVFKPASSGKKTAYFNAATNTWTGSTAETFNRMALESGMSYVVVNQTAESRARYTSSFTACAEDVARGCVDVCVGEFIMTPNRLALAPFVTTMHDTFTYFYARESVADFAAELGRVFTPFTAELWGTIIVAIVAASSILLMVERLYSSGSSDFPPDMSMTHACLVSNHLGILGFFSAGPIHSPESFAGRLIVLSMGFLILVSSAACAANRLMLTPTDTPQILPRF